MCIAILNNSHSPIKKATLKNCFNNNDDGAGYVFSKDNKLQFKKGFFTFKSFWNSYNRDMIENKNPITAIHFRITTHGKTNADNCHPFQVNKKLGFIHNGIIQMVSTDAKRSDTNMFNEKLLKQLPSNFIRNSAIMNLIEESIGQSKLVFLDNEGRYVIANESLGHWVDNVWYSNDSYIKCNTYYGQYSYYGVPAYTKSNKPKSLTTGYFTGMNKSSKLPKPRKTQCTECKSPLYTHYEKNNGLCTTCNTGDYIV